MKIFCAIIICLLCFGLFAQEKESSSKRLKVLILGGTTFLGPHLTQELLKHGHKVTHFNRGTVHEFSFPEVETLHGVRCNDMKALEGRKWDAVIDTCGYLPKVVEASSKLLAKATRHYTFISTISVYSDFSQSHINEDSPLVTFNNDYKNDEITEETYGPYKVGCERVIKTYFPDNSLIIRPGIIVGPYDPTNRFTYWVRKISEGGDVLVPNVPNQKIQFIDVRDLVQWIVKMIEEQSVGTYNATGPKEILTFQQFINACSQFAKNKVNLVWVNEQRLLDRQISLPFWLPSKRNMMGIFEIDSRKAQYKGLSYRPLSETISDTIKWDCQRKDRTLKAGLSRDEEQTLLKQLYTGST